MMKTFLLMVEALIYIATQAGAKPVNGKSMSAALNYSPRHMEPILQLLVHKDILRSTRGPRGGYTLKCERRKLPLSKIYRIACLDDVDEKSKKLKQASVKTSEKMVIKSLSDGLEEVIVSHLEDVTLEDICVRVQSCRQMKGDYSLSDFII